MSQVLRIGVKRNFQDDKCLMTIHYHWSGYSNCASVEAKELIDFYDNEIGEEKLKTISDKELILKTIRHFESIGGGINGKEEETKYIKNMYPGEKFSDKQSRNNGLISISEKGMNIAEGTCCEVEISVNDRKVGHYLNSWYSSFEELAGEREDCGLSIPKKEDIVEVDYDLEEFGWDIIDQVVNDTENEFIKYKEKYYELYID